MHTILILDCADYLGKGDWSRCSHETIFYNVVQNTLNLTFFPKPDSRNHKYGYFLASLLKTKNIYGSWPLTLSSTDGLDIAYCLYGVESGLRNSLGAWFKAFDIYTWILFGISLFV